jgi:hypothetical protein
MHLMLPPMWTRGNSEWSTGTVCGSFLLMIVVGADGFGNCFSADFAIVFLRYPIPVLALRNVIQHTFDHDTCAFEGELTVTDLWIGNDVLTQFCAFPYFHTTFLCCSLHMLQNHQKLQERSSSSAFASLRSAVSNPSVNQL